MMNKLFGRNRFEADDEKTTTQTQVRTTCLFLNKVPFIPPSGVIILIIFIYMIK